MIFAAASPTLSYELRHTADSSSQHRPHVQHVVQEGDPSVGLALASAVQVEGHTDPGLLGAPLNSGNSLCRQGV